ncbi:hypothetical protein Zmor_015556 [Zophobas morio]|uniref:Uncharacterized protein n=1 Tax=Zophobas morio TaxID=2755281 RepID=A0AA38MHQ1_9CUCU|nr:hypothetical protein Zmor_015556 [Zophobas morio]
MLTRLFFNHISTVIREARLDYEKRIAENKDTKTLFMYIRTTLSGPVKTVKVKDAAGMVNDNSYTVADIFADSLAKVFTVEPLSGMPNLSSVCNSNSTTNIKFSPDAVSEKLRRLKVTKSPSPDLISACVSKTVQPLFPLRFLF